MKKCISGSGFVRSFFQQSRERNMEYFYWTASCGNKYMSTAKEMFQKKA